jgi:hypothetical protein
MNFGPRSHRLYQAPGPQDSGDRADSRRDSRAKHWRPGPSNASSNQIVGEVIIDDMVRPLGASIPRPGGEFP